MRPTICFAILISITLSAAAELQVGVSRVSITPLEEGVATQLGGYGDRKGEHAHGIHDTIWAKTLVFDFEGRKTALVALDVCSLPICLVEESLAKAAVDGLTPDTVLMAASHSHAGLEGMSMDRRNIAGNPNIGIFDEAVLNFVVERVAQGIQTAANSLQPVTAGSAAMQLPGMNRNRRGKGDVDPDLTVLRLDGEDGQPLAVFVNYTAHGTIMGPKEMLISGGWPGNMQRTVEALLPGDVTCLYSNGAEGDVSPGPRTGGSRWEQAEDYGRRIGIEAAKLAASIKTKPVETFGFEVHWVDLPEHQVPPGFIKITGEEYNVTLEQIQMILPVMFPSKAPVGLVRLNEFQLATFPAEPVCSIGLSVKDAMRKAGITHPCVASLTNDAAGYILTKEEYERGGYEVTTSFYGPDLGPFMQKTVSALAADMAGR